MKKTDREILQEMVDNEDIQFDDMYSEVMDLDIGYWYRINSRKEIEDHINEMMRQNIKISHMLVALEMSESDLFQVWLGNNVEIPIPIKTKQGLMNALLE